MPEQQVKSVVVVSDSRGDEMLYVDGCRINIPGDTVYPSFIAEAAGDSLIRLSWMDIDRSIVFWPLCLSDLTDGGTNA